MSLMDRGSRITHAQAKVHFDGICKAWQTLAAAMGDDFTSYITSGYTANTPLKDIDIAIDGSTTGLATPLSIDAVSRLGPTLHQIRKNMTASYGAATTAAMVALGFGDYAKKILDAVVAYDDTYTNAWTAWAALRTGASDTTYIGGEVVDILTAVGVKVDPDYCHPPTNKYLALVEFSGAATATITTKDEIDPTLYNQHTCEWYIIARNGSPDAITVSMASCKDEADTPTDSGGTTFTWDVEVGETSAGTTGDIGQADSHYLCSTTDTTLSLTGGKDGDDFGIRVKAPRAYSLPT